MTNKPGDGAARRGRELAQALLQRGNGPERHVVMFSGGLGSWMAARRVRSAIGADTRLDLLFTDTRMEDPDLYRFIEEAAADVGGALHQIADGRTPWDVYRDERYIGNTKADPCSKILKRQLGISWLQDNCDPGATTVYVGISWDEAHRFERMVNRYEKIGWRFRAPLCEPPYLSRQHALDALNEAGIRLPRLYVLGFPHNNCGGFCCKAGQAHFALLLRRLPELYAFHEDKEQELRQLVGDHAILRDRRGGETRPMTLRDFRKRIEAGSMQLDLFEWGGCGCFVDVGDEELGA